MAGPGLMSKATVALNYFAAGATRSGPKQRAPIRVGGSSLERAALQQ
jgi:hypothetical protein